MHLKWNHAVHILVLFFFSVPNTNFFFFCHRATSQGGRTLAIPHTRAWPSITLFSGWSLEAGWGQRDSELHMWTFLTAEEYKGISQSKDSRNPPALNGELSSCTLQSGMEARNCFKLFLQLVSHCARSEIFPSSWKVFNNSAHFWNHSG